MAGLGIILLLVGTLVSEGESHPVTATVVLLIVALGIAGFVAASIQRKRRHKIEQQRLWEIEVARSYEVARYHAMTPKDFEHALAKRYAPTTKVVGPDLQKFGGTCFTVHQAQVAAVVTTSAFTKQARHYAALTGIRLYDQQALAAWATQTGPAPTPADRLPPFNG